MSEQIRGGRFKVVLFSQKQEMAEDRGPDKICEKRIAGRGKS